MEIGKHTLEEILELWGEKLGFLDGLDGKIKEIVGYAFEHCAQTILKGEQTVEHDSETIIFPLIRRILQDAKDDVYFAEDRIENFVEKLIKEIDTEKNKFYKEFEEKLKDLDKEAEFCAYFSKNFDIKKYF